MVTLNVEVGFRCPFCPCIFSSQADLDLHLEAFGNVSHLKMWRDAYVQLEVDGHNAGVDDCDGYEFSLDKRIARYLRKGRSRRKVKVYA